MITYETSTLVVGECPNVGIYTACTGLVLKIRLKSDAAHMCAGTKKRTRWSEKRNGGKNARIRTNIDSLAFRSIRFNQTNTCRASFLIVVCFYSPSFFAFDYLIRKNGVHFFLIEDCRLHCICAFSMYFCSDLASIIKNLFVWMWSMRNVHINFNVFFCAETERKVQDWKDHTHEYFI